MLKLTRSHDVAQTFHIRPKLSNLVCGRKQGRKNYSRLNTQHPFSRLLSFIRKLKEVNHITIAFYNKYIHRFIRIKLA